MPNLIPDRVVWSELDILVPSSQMASENLEDLDGSVFGRWLDLK